MSDTNTTNPDYPEGNSFEETAVNLRGLVDAAQIADGTLVTFEYQQYLEEDGYDEKKAAQRNTFTAIRQGSYWYFGGKDADSYFGRYDNRTFVDLLAGPRVHSAQVATQFAAFKP
jgi:hypothetical protein